MDDGYFGCTSCQTAVVDHYRLRQDYWSQNAGCDPVAWMMGISVVLLGFVILKRMCGRRCPGSIHRQKVMAVMDAIRGNPELKAHVESTTGVTVPDKPVCPAAAMKPYIRGCILGLMAVLSGFMIAMSSLFITVALLTPPPQENPTAPVEPPSVAFALSILALVATAEISLFFLVLSRFRRQPVPTTATIAGTDTTKPTPVVEVSSAPPSQPPRTGFLSFAPTFGMLSRTFSRGSSNGDYAALMVDESQHGPMQSEMVTITRPASDASTITVVPLAPYRPYVGVPVLAARPDDNVLANAVAQPMSHIRMI